jgi:endonuclease/exonuclease/phosphatase family metal-dependent hydrolase
MSQSIGLPAVSREERTRILGLPQSERTHRDLYEQMIFRTGVEIANVETASGEHGARAGRGGFTVVAWNAARCAEPAAFGRVLSHARADVALMTEMDWGMARSGNRHTARALAKELNMGYAYAVEFLELGLGDELEKNAHRGKENEIGYHGAAILASSRLAGVERIVLEESGGWFDASRGQRRVGGRIALSAIAEVEIGGKHTPVVFCAVHVESESDADERARETIALFDRIDARYAGLPVIIGGDLNCFSVPRRELDDPAAIDRRLAADTARFSHPVPYEPLFAAAASRGYTWADCNVPEVPTHRHDGTAGPDVVLKIDWFLCRDIAAGSPRVIEPVDPQTGRRISDHAAIAITVGIG